VELYEQIRQEYEYGAGTIRAVARKLGVHRREVRKALASALPAERKIPERERPKLGSAIPFIDAILEADRKAPRKQRHTAHRIWMRLRREKPEAEVAESTVRQYVRARKAAIGLLGREIFVPQSYQFGGEAQVDWYEGWVEFDGERRKTYVFCLRSMASGGAFHRAYPHANQQAFLEAHELAFAYFGGVFRVLRYDNLKSAVLERRGNEIHFHPRLLELCAHYHFVARPCQVRAGNQKGRVERAIRYIRDSFWAGRSFTTLADWNRQAWEWRDRVAHPRRWPGAGDNTRSVAEVFTEEQSRLLPLPQHPFPTDLVMTVCSRKTIYVRFDLNDYSIPPEVVGRPLSLVASDTEVRILDGTTEIARHPRSYDRGQEVLHPPHQQALLEAKRKAYDATPLGRLALLAPESETLIDQAFAQGESAGSQTAQLLKLLDLYGPAALRRAITEALERSTPRASSVAFLLRRQPRPATKLAVDLSRHPEAQSIEVRPHDLETYDELARHRNDDNE